MDFTDTRDEAAFRADARAWLSKNAEPKRGAFETWDAHYRDEARALANAKDYQRRKAEAGFAGITWSKEHGGRGGTPIEQVI